jgi:hypothetical protein
VRSLDTACSPSSTLREGVRGTGEQARKRRITPPRCAVHADPSGRRPAGAAASAAPAGRPDGSSARAWRRGTPLSDMRYLAYLRGRRPSDSPLGNPDGSPVGTAPVEATPPQSPLGPPHAGEMTWSVCVGAVTHASAARFASMRDTSTLWRANGSRCRIVVASPLPRVRGDRRFFLSAICLSPRLRHTGRHPPQTATSEMRCRRAVDHLPDCLRSATIARPFASSACHCRTLTQP